jgi:hypothetical protein
VDGGKAAEARGRVRTRNASRRLATVAFFGVLNCLTLQIK